MKVNHVQILIFLSFNCAFVDNDQVNLFIQHFLIDCGQNITNRIDLEGLRLGEGSPPKIDLSQN